MKVIFTVLKREIFRGFKHKEFHAFISYHLVGQFSKIGNFIIDVRIHQVSLWEQEFAHAAGFFQTVAFLSTCFIIARNTSRYFTNQFQCLFAVSNECYVFHEHSFHLRDDLRELVLINHERRCNQFFNIVFYALIFGSV